MSTPATEVVKKPVTAAQRRRDAAETKKLVAAIAPRPDPDLAILTAVGETVAGLLGRPVDWGTVGLTGHTHVAVPVADLVELVAALRIRALQAVATVYLPAAEAVIDPEEQTS